MQCDEAAADTDLADRLDGLGVGCLPRLDDEVGAQRLELATGTDWASARRELGLERFVDTRELVLTAHEQRLVSGWLAIEPEHDTYSDDLSVTVITQPPLSYG